MRRAAKPSQDRSDLEAPAPEVEVPPGGGDRAGVVARPGAVAALGTAQLSAAQLDGDDHPGRLEDHFGDSHPGQVHEALECSGDAHGIGLLGSVGVSDPEPRDHPCASRGWQV